MPVRSGNWGLLGEPTDPVIADSGTIRELVAYYKDMAAEITSEATILKSIGDGDDSHFKGETADAVRKKSGEVADALHKMSGRYDAVRDALTAYLPELETALSESAAALEDAEIASAADSRAGSMADPSHNRAQDAPPLTADEQSEIDAKHRAVTAAKDSADAAVARLRRAVDGLTAAGKAAASTIRAAWDDGLHDTLGDKIKAFFSKLLKILVKIFTYIGIALAALAILIPGVGMLTFMAAVAASVTLVANIALAAMSEGSWLDVITSAVGLVLVGVGGLVTKAASVAKTTGLTKGMAGFQKDATSTIAKLKADRAVALNKAFNPRFGPADYPQRLAELRAVTAKLSGVEKKLVKSKSLGTIGTFREKPNWWHPGETLWAEDKGKIADVLQKGSWRWDRLLSVDRQIEMDDMAKFMWREHGVDIAALPRWHKVVAGGRVIGSWVNTFIYGQGIKPTGWGSDQERVPGYKNASNALVRGL